MSAPSHRPPRLLRRGQALCRDIQLAKEKLSWEPTIALNEGLVRTIAYFREAATLPAREEKVEDHV